jgi:dCTP deaminase
MIKSDRWIKQMASTNKMIEPFAPEQIKQGVISYGVSSYGYDMRVGNEFKLFSHEKFKTSVLLEKSAKKTSATFALEEKEPAPKPKKTINLEEHFIIGSGAKKQQGSMFNPFAKVNEVAPDNISEEEKLKLYEQARQKEQENVVERIKPLDVKERIGSVETDPKIFEVTGNTFEIETPKKDTTLTPSEETMLAKFKTSLIIDPKQFNEDVFESVTVNNFVIIPPGSVALAKSVEYFRIPRDIITIGFGKSTYARCGIIVNITPFEPEWEGFVTISITNVNSMPVKVYANEGIAQILFLQANEVCETSYADRKGKYQAQQDITSAKV